MFEEREKKMCSEEEIINASRILKNITHQKYILLPIMWRSAINLYQIYRNSSRSSLSTLIGSLMKKRQADQTHVFPEKSHLEKVKENGIAIASLILAISYHSDCWIVL